MASKRSDISLVVSVIAVFFAGASVVFTYQILQLSEDTAKRQLRAYVFAVPGNVYNVSLGSRPEPRTIIRNGGDTSARNVRRDIGIRISAPLSPEQEAGLGRGTPEEGTLVLSPGGADDVVIRQARTLEDGEAEKIRAEKIRIYVFGRIEYQDMFGDSHWTEFCHIYSGEMTDWGPEHNGMGYSKTQARYCTKHNDIDFEERPVPPHPR